MSEYLVEWSIELSADSPEEAACLALAIQRDPSSRATAFDVIECDGSGEAIHINTEEIPEIAI